MGGRSYERDDFTPIRPLFDPLPASSGMALWLERKTGALDQAAPLAGWELPEEFGVLRRLMESRMGRRGKREFVQVLRLMENFRTEEVYESVRDALGLGAISFDAVKHLVLCRMRVDLSDSTWSCTPTCGAEVIARHPRSYERDDFVFDPVHYLPLERKTGALDQAAPLAGWELPEEFDVCCAD